MLSSLRVAVRTPYYRTAVQYIKMLCSQMLDCVHGCTCVAADSDYIGAPSHCVSVCS